MTVSEGVPERVAGGTDEDSRRHGENSRVQRRNGISQPRGQKGETRRPNELLIHGPHQEANWKTEDHQTGRRMSEAAPRRQPEKVFEVRGHGAEYESFERQAGQEATERPRSRRVGRCQRHEITSRCRISGFHCTSKKLRSY